MTQEVLPVGKLEIDSWLHGQVVLIMFRAFYIVSMYGVLYLGWALYQHTQASDVAITMLIGACVYHIVQGEYCIGYMLPRAVLSDQRKILDHAGYFEIDPHEVCIEDKKKPYRLVLHART